MFDLTGMLTKVDPTGVLRRSSARGTWPRNESSCAGTWNDDDQGVSKHWYVNFAEIDNFPPFGLVALHFLAQPTNGARCGPREAQAEVIIDIIQNNTGIFSLHLLRQKVNFWHLCIFLIEYNSGYETIVLGDFNDYDGDVLDRDENVPITHVLEWIKATSSKSDRSDAVYNLTNTAIYMNQDDRYTHYSSSNYDGDCIFTPSQTQQLDFILTSPQLTDMVHNVTTYSNFCGLYNPDHLPLVITLSAEESGGDGDDSDSDTDSDSGVGRPVGCQLSCLIVVLVWLLQG